MNIKIVEQARVSAVEPDALVLGDGRLPFDICVWCGGLEVPRFPEAAGLETNAQGRILVDPWLRSITDERIYAVGDACIPMHRTGAPPRISVLFALTTGAFVADAIEAERRGRRIAGFTFASFGQGIQVARGGAGFAAFPFDRALPPIFTGRLAYKLRQFFVRLPLFFIRWEKRHPRLPFWRIRAPGVKAPRMPSARSRREIATGASAS